MRAESAPMKFGDDWRGVFIRGDTAIADARALKEALHLWALVSGDDVSHREVVLRIHLGGLVALLESAHERAPADVQLLKSFRECVIRSEGTPCTTCYKAHYDYPEPGFVCPCSCHEEET